MRSVPSFIFQWHQAPADLYGAQQQDHPRNAIKKTRGNEVLKLATGASASVLDSVTTITQPGVAKIVTQRRTSNWPARPCHPGLTQIPLWQIWTLRTLLRETTKTCRGAKKHHVRAIEDTQFRLGRQGCQIPQVRG